MTCLVHTYGWESDGDARVCRWLRARNVRESTKATKATVCIKATSVAPQTIEFVMSEAGAASIVVT